DNYSTFRNTCQELVAVTAYGIKNQGGTGGNWNLYTGGAQDGDGGRVSLLGAVRIPPEYPGGGPYAFLNPLDQNGDPLFVISNVPTWPIVGAFMPEPASLLLMALAGLLLRRR
ncbi:MAG: hypothetical protein KAY37_14950, partial [Phycisphaerae bacterium]|nr:hypothetical protein [Phycisphaerae bacterium]